MNVVFAFFDAESDVWVAHSDDIAGLNTEASSLDKLRLKIHACALDLIELNEGLITHLSHNFELVIRDVVTATR